MENSSGNKQRKRVVFEQKRLREAKCYSGYVSSKKKVTPPHDPQQEYLSSPKTPPSDVPVAKQLNSRRDKPPEQSLIINDTPTYSRGILKHSTPVPFKFRMFPNNTKGKRKIFSPTDARQLRWNLHIYPSGSST
ncbi:hypothetical protein TNCT_662751 [Trichonephila clavata]|uniref:Uncharacterized protein n=1 Tax=Trichonephila clavata TaxID=2740835 RepID=A0A8X6LKA9_TRICU|nr:hypothetical protein TNCT_662751 [Trichonephila clavata]